MDIEKIVEVMDIELQVTERLYMSLDSYKREEYESAMSDHFYYLYAVDKFEDAIGKLTPEEFRQYIGVRDFDLEFLNDTK